MPCTWIDISVMKKTTSQKCVAQNMNSVEIDQKEFAFILKEDEMSKRLKFCVGGVDLKMLVD